MASEKKITMREYNGTDYDTLYPKTIPEQIEGLDDMFYTKDQTLVDGVKALYELNSTATPNDIFAKLALPANYYGFKILVLSPTGEPVPNCLLPDAFVDMHGNTGVKTGADGTVYCGSATQSVTFNLGGNYFGVADKEYTITANTSTPFTPVTIRLENNAALTSMTLITSSFSSSMLGNINDIDLCAVGGGGGGSSWYNGHVGGGGGGYVSNLLAYSLTGKKAISFQIGAGGSYSGNGSAGGNGGNTKILVDDSLILSANGGQGGQPGAGGTGNGNGGYISAGGNGTVRVFNDGSLPLPGGGGGCGDYAGGKDFGGAGTKTTSGAYSGTGPGGGGGSSTSGGSYGGKGYSGGVYLRVRYK